MSEPRWLTRSEVERIHEKVIDAGGGSHGLRDASLLESALARPKNLHSYGEKDHFQLAASYAEGISRNHSFVDGNKRTAFQSADIFLYNNGIELKQDKGDKHVTMMENLGQGKITREQAADYLRENSKNIEKNQREDTDNPENTKQQFRNNREKKTESRTEKKHQSKSRDRTR